MTPYTNDAHSSGILTYESGPDYITVQFKRGKYRFYKYTYTSAGSTNVEHMKQLAVQGSGLNAFIKITVPDDFESRW